MRLGASGAARTLVASGSAEDKLVPMGSIDRHPATISTIPAIVALLVAIVSDISVVEEGAMPPPDQLPAIVSPGALPILPTPMPTPI